MFLTQASIDFLRHDFLHTLESDKSHGELFFDQYLLPCLLKYELTDFGETDFTLTLLRQLGLDYGLLVIKNDRPYLEETFIIEAFFKVRGFTPAMMAFVAKALAFCLNALKLDNNIENFVEMATEDLDKELDELLGSN
jgi:hypothetical protein